MPVKVITLDVVVVVFPVSRACVVGRVNVNGVNLPSVGVGQRLKDVIVLTVDDCVIRLIAPRAGLCQC